MQRSHVRVLPTPATSRVSVGHVQVAKSCAIFPRLSETIASLANFQYPWASCRVRNAANRVACNLSLAQEIAWKLGGLHLDLELFDDAERWFTVGGELNQGWNLRHLLGRSSVLLARARTKALDGGGRDAEATKLLNEAAVLAAEVRDRASADDSSLLARLHSVIGSIFRELRRFDESIENYRKSLTYRRALGSALDLARTEANLAGVLEARATAGPPSRPSTALCRYLKQQARGKRQSTFAEIYNNSIQT